MYLTIFQSIENCRLLHFHYDGYSRVVEPHLFGVDRRGLDVLYGYQVAGADIMGRHIGWKCYVAKDMHTILALDARFVGPRVSYDPNFHTWQRVYVQVDGRPIASSSHRVRV